MSTWETISVDSFTLYRYIMQAYTCSHYICPICSKSLGDMTVWMNNMIWIIWSQWDASVSIDNYEFSVIQVYFGMLDALLALEVLPEEYRERCQVNVTFLLTFFKVITSLSCLPVKDPMLTKLLITDWLFLRIYCAMTAPRRRKRASIGCTINVNFVHLIIPRWLRLAQIPAPQHWISKLQCLWLSTCSCKCTLKIGILVVAYSNGRFNFWE